MAKKKKNFYQKYQNHDTVDIYVHIYTCIIKTFIFHTLQQYHNVHIDITLN